LSMSPRKSTTVLATEMAKPRTIPAGTDQPHKLGQPAEQSGERI
jgi:hypothetical protein